MSVPAAATATAGSARLGVLQDKSNLPAAATLHRVHSDAKRNTENALGARKALAPSPQARPAAQGALRVFRDLQADSKSRLGTDGGGEEPQLRAASAPAATATESLNTGSAARTSWWLRKRATSVDAGVPASRAPPAFVPYRDPAVSPLHARHATPAAAARQDQPAAARVPFQQVVHQVVHPKRGSFPAAHPPPAAARVLAQPVARKKRASARPALSPVAELPEHDVESLGLDCQASAADAAIVDAATFAAETPSISWDADALSSPKVSDQHKALVQPVRSYASELLELLDRNQAIDDIDSCGKAEIIAAQPPDNPDACAESSAKDAAVEAGNSSGTGLSPEQNDHNSAREGSRVVRFALPPADDDPILEFGQSTTLGGVNKNVITYKRARKARPEGPNEPRLMLNRRDIKWWICDEALPTTEEEEWLLF
ncbi:hypothetical protein HDU83_005904 [Entophlyctis luteolus]|nr:hypothetical protein HDU83_005904 [Entophlyctis luteolus]